MTSINQPFSTFGNGIAGDEFNNERIRKLRLELNMTQESFAHEIGVTFATVNRWENGRTTPNKVAQKVLRLMEKKLRKMKKV
jgi:putative transcriptional regulator